MRFVLFCFRFFVFGFCHRFFSLMISLIKFIRRYFLFIIINYFIKTTKIFLFVLFLKFLEYIKIFNLKNFIKLKHRERKITKKESLNKEKKRLTFLSLFFSLPSSF